LSLEDDLLEQRVKRAAEIEALGFRAYGQRFDFTHTIPEILAAESAKTAEELTAAKPQVRIAGRIQTMRRMGKAGFFHLMQRGERLQVYVRSDAVNEREYALYQLLDIGDIVGVEGYLFRTRTGELSVHAEKLTFLSKILLAMRYWIPNATLREMKKVMPEVEKAIEADVAERGAAASAPVGAGGEADSRRRASRVA